MTAINTKRPIEIYDDRNKVFNIYTLSKILFEDDKQILAEIIYSDEPYRICIDRSDNSVHSKLFNSSWYARNYETESTKKLDEAIKFIKASYVSQPGRTEFMILEDVAALVTSLTEINVQTTDLLNL